MAARGIVADNLNKMVYDLDSRATDLGIKIDKLPVFYGNAGIIFPFHFYFLITF